MQEKSETRSRPRRRAARPPAICHCCNQQPPFCWRCRHCGFAICQRCMLENAWTLTCNGITWVCPDCGQQNGLGNQ